LDFFEGKSGSPSWGAWLGHGYDADREVGGTWVIVGSFPVRGSREVMMHSDETFEHYLASIATRVLFNDSVVGPARLEKEPARWTTWPSTPLTADGQPVPAHVLERGDAWAAFTAGLPDVGLVIHASGLVARELALVAVTDSSAYHFKMDEPLEYADVLISSRKAAFER
jgi:hypothetical protein